MARRWRTGPGAETSGDRANSRLSRKVRGHRPCSRPQQPRRRLP
jgi:hypothetical protein